MARADLGAEQPVDPLHPHMQDGNVAQVFGQFDLGGHALPRRHNAQMLGPQTDPLDVVGGVRRQRRPQL